MALFNGEGGDQCLCSLEHKNSAMPANLPNILERKNGAMQLVRQDIQTFGGSPVRLQWQKPSNSCRWTPHFPPAWSRHCCSCQCSCLPPSWGSQPIPNVRLWNLVHAQQNPKRNFWHRRSTLGQKIFVLAIFQQNGRQCRWDMGGHERTRHVAADNPKTS